MDDISSLQAELAHTQRALYLVSQINLFKTGLIGRSAHELRSPLTSLISLLQLILNDLCEDPKEEREFLTQALTAAERLMTMIDELVMVSKLDYGAIAFDLSPIELSSLLDELQSLLHLPASNRNIRFRICPPENPTYFKADRHKLLQGLVVILEGVIHNQDGGEIQLWTEHEKPGGTFVALMVKIPFSEPWWQADSGIAPLPARLTLETLRDWSQSIHLSRGMQWQVVERLVQSMGGELAWEEIAEESLSMTQLRFRFPLCNPLGTDQR
jgi:K+-sensing histidine kinase KdpD